MLDIPPVHRLVLKRQGRLERLVDAQRNIMGSRSVGAVQENGKLVAPQARHHVVGRTHLLAQALGDGLQQAVVTPPVTYGDVVSKNTGESQSDTIAG